MHSILILSVFSEKLNNLNWK